MNFWIQRLTQHTHLTTAKGQVRAGAAAQQLAFRVFTGSKLRHPRQLNFKSNFSQLRKRIYLLYIIFIDNIRCKRRPRRRWIYYWCVSSPSGTLCNRVSRLFPPLFIRIRGTAGYRREWGGRRRHRAQMLAQLQRRGDARVNGYGARRAQTVWERGMPGWLAAELAHPPDWLGGWSRGPIRQNICRTKEIKMQDQFRAPLNMILCKMHHPHAVPRSLKEASTRCLPIFHRFVILWHQWVLLC